jgi:pectinesterase
MKLLKHIICTTATFLLLVMLCNNSFCQNGIKKIIVDKNGKGNFTSIQNAINSLDDSSTKPRIIFIKN